MLTERVHCGATRAWMSLTDCTA